MTAMGHAHNPILAVAARFITQAEERYLAQAGTIEELSRSSAGRPAAVDVLDAMRETLAIARLYEQFLQTLDDVDNT